MKKTVTISLLVLISFTSSFSQMDTRFISETFNSGPILEIAKDDTIKALQHLYKRKKNGGTARAVVFGILGTAVLVGTLSYKPDYVTINQGSGATQRIEVSSPPGAINYLFIGFNTGMAISGVIQAKKYN